MKTLTASIICYIIYTAILSLANYQLWNIAVVEIFDIKHITWNQACISGAWITTIIWLAKTEVQFIFNPKSRDSDYYNPQP